MNTDSSGNYKSGFKKYKRNLRWKSTMRKQANGMDPSCPKCGSPMYWRDSAGLTPLHPEGAWECSNQRCWNMLTPGELAPEYPPEDLDRLPPASPYAQMPSLPSNPDNSSSGLTVPEHFERGQMTSPEDFAAFMQGYFDAALWTSDIGEEYAEAQTAEFGDDESFQALHGGELNSDQSMADAGLTDENIDSTSKSAQSQECRNFVNDNSADLHAYLDQLGFNTKSGWSQAGHDFWLTRNRHGTGFWDRDSGELGHRLTEAAKVYGETNAYMGDDGQIYIQ